MFGDLEPGPNGIYNSMGVMKKPTGVGTQILYGQLVEEYDSGAGVIRWRKITAATAAKVAICRTTEEITSITNNRTGVTTSTRGASDDVAGVHLYNAGRYETVAGAAIQPGVDVQPDPADPANKVVPLTTGKRLGKYVIKIGQGDITNGLEAAALNDRIKIDFDTRNN